MATSEHQKQELINLVPHPRTIRKAREQIRYMVIDGVSRLRIKNYLHRFVLWWQKTEATWKYDEILNSYLAYCWDLKLGNQAQELLTRFKLSCNPDSIACCAAA